ncbi:hypothetical protein C8A05DRAFT_38386 [Staphylotrichum tortipilum]|uniref:Sodium/calcium exchanger membrane region domain-containing protein n=1 Tax=Staphylotrichum tortipilum TaxID=2831512 RepID=A0AAN6RPI7_9PEZI|nr:hypothetical protein C8A05DRAFT_38386 [Staphylotrichum longicolle]
MADASSVAYHVAVFVSALFLLESGADKFIDHTAIVASRTGISETVIGLLTAGGEWEELAVVIACLTTNRTSLALGNIIGSSISNILGAFSLGLLFSSRDAPLEFDRSSRIYSLVLLALTTAVIPLVYFPSATLWRVCGPVLIVVFVGYVASVAVAVGRGVLDAPEGSDSESESDIESEVGAERSPLLHPHEAPTTRPRQLRRHILLLLLGLGLLTLSGYLLSASASALTDELNLSSVLFGVVILALATTLPEKMVALLSGRRGRAGILLAGCAGSNIFLLTLCLGVSRALGLGNGQ